MLPILTARTLQLARAAKDARLGFNIDAEEADRLDLSLDVIEDRRIMVRLVKGAYWDTEIKRAQVLGLDGFPVFTRKSRTDVSYMACARKLLSMTDRIYPQFATHNAHTVAAVLHMAGGRTDAFEFQRLHGMGESLHAVVMGEDKTRCRIYAPVGAHRDLLAYLVRRLLENGANSSFVNQIVDEDVSPEVIARDPIEAVLAQSVQARKAITPPAKIFPRRTNSRGWDITDPNDLKKIEAARAPFLAPHRWGDEGVEIRNPGEPDEVVGFIKEETPESVSDAITAATTAQPDWAARRARGR